MTSGCLEMRHNPDNLRFGLVVRNTDTNLVKKVPNPDTIIRDMLESHGHEIIAIADMEDDDILIIHSSTKLEEHEIEAIMLRELKHVKALPFEVLVLCYTKNEKLSSLSYVICDIPVYCRTYSSRREIRMALSDLITVVQTMA